MSNPNPAEGTTSTPAPVILLGLDQAGRAHASRFSAEQAEKASKAAEMMGMHILKVNRDEIEVIADKISIGKIYQSGSAFVPFISRPVFDQLAALGGIKVESVDPKAAKHVQAAGAKGKGENATSVGGKGSKKAAPTPQPEIAPYVEPTNIPQDWPHIREGSLVLASTGEDAAGYFASTVVEVKADDLLVLQFRDYETPLFLRRRNQLALLPEGTPLKEGE